MKGKVFTAQEVQAIINGSKVMFREVIKPQPNNYDSRTEISFLIDGDGQLLWHDDNYSWFRDPEIILHKTWIAVDGVKCPYRVRQKIFCKESFLYGANGEIQLFDSNYEGYCSSYWIEKPAQHMKQEHSRLILEIKSIGVEKLHHISDGDVEREGINLSEPLPRQYWLEHDSFRKALFAQYWNATHKKPEEKFENSPWVWVVSFEVIK